MPELRPEAQRIRPIRPNPVKAHRDQEPQAEQSGAKGKRRKRVFKPLEQPKNTKWGSCIVFGGNAVKRKKEGV